MIPHYRCIVLDLIRSHLNESIFEDLVTIGISSLILGAILVFIGLWVSAKANLGAPLITRFLV